jgi:hypothetical protein
LHVGIDAVGGDLPLWSGDVGAAPPPFPAVPFFGKSPHAQHPAFGQIVQVFQGSWQTP